MKLIHLTDQHCGGAYPDKVEKSFDFLIEQLWGNSESPAYLPDLIYSTGDLTDRPLHIHSEYLKPFLRFVKAAQCPIILLQGTSSHEPLGTINNIAAVSDGKIHVIDSPLQTVNVAGFTVQGMPGLSRPLLAKWCREAEIPVDGFEDPNEAVRQLFVRMAMRWGRGPRILGGHLTVGGCKTSSGQAMTGNDITVALEDFLLAAPTVVRLGHIHAAQEWWLDQLHIAFGGSSSPCNFGELDKKYFRVDHFADSGIMVSTELLQYPHRAMVKVDMEFTGEQMPDGSWACDYNGEADIDTELSDKEVKVVYAIPREIAAAVDDSYVRVLFAQHGVDLAVVERVIKTEARERIEGISSMQTTADQYRSVCQARGVEARPGAIGKANEMDESGATNGAQ